MAELTVAVEIFPNNTALATVSGGVVGYTFHWSTGDTTPNIFISFFHFCFVLFFDILKQ
jgi:hypothetical protein